MIRKNLLVGAAIAVAALCGTLFAQPTGSPVARYGQLSVKNGKIVDKNGDPVALRGMSFYWDRSDWNGHQYYTAGAVNTLASSWNVDIIRAAFSGPQGNNGKIKTVVDAAIDKGIYVILDYHSHTANSEVSTAKSFFDNYLGSNYLNKPNLLYEIFNEPIGSTTFSDDHTGYWNNTVRPYAVDMVKYIRDKGAKNIILIGTPFYCLKLGPAQNNPVPGENLAYTLHFYSGDANHGLDKSGQIGNMIKAGNAVFVSEFGTTEASGKGKYGFDQATEWFRVLDTYSVGWCNWSVSAFEESSALSGGADANGSGWSTSQSGTYIKGKLNEYATKTWSVTVTTDGQGSVTQSPPGQGGKQRHGTPVTLTAVPAAGWSFVGWSGAATGKDKTVTLEPVYADKSVKAIFTEAGNLIQNGKFTDLSNWVKSPSSGELAPTMTVDAQGLKVQITKATAGDSKSAYITQGDISLTQGHKYKLSFKAKADGGSRKLIVAVTSNNTVTAYMTPLEASLTTTMTEYKTEFDFTKASVTNARVLFQCGDQTGTWYLNEVKLEDIGNATSVRNVSSLTERTPWSLVKTSSGVRLRGPIEVGATAALYDTRGKIVKSITAKDGLTLNAAGVPAGSYLVVVKNRAGADVYRSRVSFVR
jgi:endoglucanase